MTGLLCLAQPVVYNPLGLTVVLPTHITLTHQNMPTESHIRHYGKISNAVQHRQHLHNQLDSLPACPACAALQQYHCLDNVTLKG